MKRGLLEAMADLGISAEDLGTGSRESVDYPDYAAAVAGRVSVGAADTGVLVCGTGIGMSIAANKFPNVRCALCHNLYTARLSREHNDANILAMGERVIGAGIAREMVKIFLETAFEGGRHMRRVDKIKALDKYSERSCP